MAQTQSFHSGWAFSPRDYFLGRSNVGKSSLLNHVTFSSDLNRVSATPGATKTMWRGP